MKLLMNKQQSYIIEKNRRIQKKMSRSKANVTAQFINLDSLRDLKSQRLVVRKPAQSPPRAKPKGDLREMFSQKLELDTVVNKFFQDRDFACSLNQTSLLQKMEKLKDILGQMTEQMRGSGAKEVLESLNLQPNEEFPFSNFPSAQRKPREKIVLSNDGFQGYLFPPKNSQSNPLGGSYLKNNSVQNDSVINQLISFKKPKESGLLEQGNMNSHFFTQQNSKKYVRRKSSNEQFVKVPNVIKAEHDIPQLVFKKERENGQKI